LAAKRLRQDSGASSDLLSGLAAARLRWGSGARGDHRI